VRGCTDRSRPLAAARCRSRSLPLVARSLASLAARCHSSLPLARCRSPPARSLPLAARSLAARCRSLRARRCHSLAAARRPLAAVRSCIGLQGRSCARCMHMWGCRKRTLTVAQLCTVASPLRLGGGRGGDACVSQHVRAEFAEGAGVCGRRAQCNGSCVRGRNTYLRCIGRGRGTQRGGILARGACWGGGWSSVGVDGVSGAIGSRVRDG
jgi:hypothetical protein